MMYKNRNLSCLFRIAGFAFLLAAALIIFPGTAGLAAVYEYPSQMVRLTLPDDILVMDSSTPKYDEVWMKAGVTDASARLKEFKNMGVVAAFYDPATQTTVNFMSKQNTDTVSIFTFDGMSDDEIKAYVEGLISSNDDVDVDISVLRLGEIPYFRLTLSGKSDKAVGTEVIYGTAKNGQMLQFDVYSQLRAEIDESFLEQAASGLEFTAVLSKEEYTEKAEEEAHKFMIRAGIFFGFMLLLIVYYFIHKAYAKKRLARISAAITDFRGRRNSGAISDNDEPDFTAASVYNDEALNSFSVYNTWIKALPVLAPCTLLYIFIIFMMITYGYPMYALITGVIGIVVLYMHYSRLDKLRESMKKSMNVGNSPTLTARFFKEYLITGGAGSIAEYPYLQLTGVHTYQDYIFIYYSSENAIILKKSGVAGNRAAQLVSFLKDSIREQKKRIMEKA